MTRSPNRKVVFVALTEREILFYIECAQELMKRHADWSVELISFFEPGMVILESAGLRAHNFYTELKSTPTDIDFKQAMPEFSLAEIDSLLRHEEVTMEIKDRSALREKLTRYVVTSERLLKKIRGELAPGQLVVFQELGGFFAILSVFFAARRMEVPHFFFEPAFYKGRLLAVENSLMAARPKISAQSAISSEALRYLQDAISQKTTVIPQKDRHHFRDMSIGKILNPDNVRKLRRKLVNKYVRRMNFEFDHIGTHVRRALRMLANRKRRRDLYTNSIPDQDFVYYPLHVELDYSLTIRSPQYFDQLEVLGQIAKRLPPGVLILAKEHPASIGGFSQEKLTNLMKSHPNFKLLHPSFNSYELVEGAKAIVTINSKVGAESLAMKKTVIALGDAFYSSSPLIHFAEDFDSMGELLRKALSDELKTDWTQFDSFFSQVWSDSFAGELYVNDAENVSRVVDGLEKTLSSRLTPLNVVNMEIATGQTLN